MVPAAIADRDDQLFRELADAWTSFVTPLQEGTGWSLRDIQAAFTLFIFFQTGVQPIDGFLIDRPVCAAPSPWRASCAPSRWPAMVTATSVPTSRLCWTRGWSPQPLSLQPGFIRARALQVVQGETRPGPPDDMAAAASGVGTALSSIFFHPVDDCHERLSPDLSWSPESFKVS